VKILGIKTGVTNKITSEYEEKGPGVKKGFNRARPKTYDTIQLRRKNETNQYQHLSTKKKLKGRNFLEMSEGNRRGTFQRLRTERERPKGEEVYSGGNPLIDGDINVRGNKGERACHHLTREEGRL